LNNFSTPQRTLLCQTCPFARTTSKEYLDTRGDNGERFLAQANMNAVLPCHCEDHGSATVGVCQQCAGAAKFRANIGVTGLSPTLGTLPPDTENVFATNAELLAHHKGWTVTEAEAVLQGDTLQRWILHEFELGVARSRMVGCDPARSQLVFTYEEQSGAGWRLVK